MSASGAKAAGEMAERWLEQESCARCGSALEADHITNHLGVRFCQTCFAETAHQHARGADPALREVCNRCKGSLINGYATNYMGVFFCSSCFERTHTPDGRPRQDWEERAKLSTVQVPREEEDDFSVLDEEEEGVFLHDVFLATTILALIMYALSHLSGQLLTLGGF